MKDEIGEKIEKIGKDFFKCSKTEAELFLIPFLILRDSRTQIIILDYFL